MVPFLNIDWVSFSSQFTAVVVAAVALYKAVEKLVKVIKGG